MDSEIDAKTFWKALGCRAIGVAIVTAKGADGPAGFLALSATHLSASPPMMMVSIGLTTSALAAVRHANHFAINYVPKGGDALVKEFGGGGSLKGADRFVAGAWTELTTGAPALVDAVRRHRLPSRGIDRAPRRRHRPGPGRGLQRFVEGPAHQLPRRLSLRVARRDQGRLPSGVRSSHWRASWMVRNSRIRRPGRNIALTFATTLSFPAEPVTMAMGPGVPRQPSDLAYADSCARSGVGQGILAARRIQDLAIVRRAGRIERGKVLHEVGHGDHAFGDAHDHVLKRCDLPAKWHWDLCDARPNDRPRANSCLCAN